MRDRSLQIPLLRVSFTALDRELPSVKWCGGGSVKGGAQALDGGGFFRERGPPKSRAHARTMHLTRGAQRQPAIATLPALHVFGGPEFLSIWTWNYIHYFQILSEYCRARPSLLAESTLAAIAANPLIFSPSPPAAAQRPSPLSHRNASSPPFPLLGLQEVLPGWQRSSQHPRRSLCRMSCYT